MTAVLGSGTGATENTVGVAWYANTIDCGHVGRALRVASTSVDYTGAFLALICGRTSAPRQQVALVAARRAVAKSIGIRVNRA